MLIKIIRSLKIFFSLFVIIFFALTQCLFAQNANEQVGDFVLSLSNDVIAVLKNNENNLMGRKAGFQEIFEKAGDVPKIAKFVAGPAWKNASAEQQQNYITVYREYMAYTYASRITQYNNQQVKIGRISDLGTNGFLVDTQLITPNTNNVMSVIWQLSNDANGFKVTDLRVENISMSLTQRAEFAAYLALNNNSLEKLIELLKMRLKN